MINLAICGIAGKMGRAIVSCCAQDEEVTVTGALEQKGHPLCGRSLKDSISDVDYDVVVTDNSAEAFQGSDAVISFSSVAGSLAHVDQAMVKKIPIVVGTTGFSQKEQDMIKAASEKVAVCLAPNMSVGINLLFQVVREVASRLKDGYDVEVIEAHHRFKKDSPSGTAKRLVEHIADAMGLDVEKDVIYGRQGMIGERPQKQIGVHAVRAGDIVGDHTVVFSTLGERLELTHRAHSRNTFALGAIRAAKFLFGKAPGLYSMSDVLKLGS